MMDCSNSIDNILIEKYVMDNKEKLMHDIINFGEYTGSIESYTTYNCNDFSVIYREKY